MCCLWACVPGLGCRSFRACIYFFALAVCRWLALDRMPAGAITASDDRAEQLPKLSGVVILLPWCSGGLVSGQPERLQGLTG